MDHLSIFIGCVVIAGLAFDFVNGFHDASNSIATIVATRVLRPRQAVLWAAFFNISAVFLFGTGVAKTMGTGLIAIDAITPLVILCSLLAATLWGLITWRFGIPSSSSHALLGAYAGSAMANSLLSHDWQAFNNPIILSGWIKVLSFIFIAPLMGVALAYFFKRTITYYNAHAKVALSQKTFKRLQLVSSAFLSLMHGSNDAQKTAGILTGALLSAGALPSFDIPTWLLMASYITMGLGTLFGGWRIIKTMGFRLTQLNPEGGVCAESAAAFSVLFATLLNLPVSTTHITTGAIMGVGVATRPRIRGWKVGTHILWIWVVTIPTSAFLGGVIIILASQLVGK